MVRPTSIPEFKPNLMVMWISKMTVRPDRAREKIFQTIAKHPKDFLAWAIYCRG